MTTTVPVPTSFREFYPIINDNKKLPMFVREQKLVLESEDHQRPKCGSEMRDGKRQKTLKDGTVSTYEIMRCKNKQCANQLSKTTIPRKTNQTNGSYVDELSQNNIEFDSSNRRLSIKTSLGKNISQHDGIYRNARLIHTLSSAFVGQAVIVQTTDSRIHGVLETISPNLDLVICASHSLDDNNNDLTTLMPIDTLSDTTKVYFKEKSIIECSKIVEMIAVDVDMNSITKPGNIDENSKQIQSEQRNNNTETLRELEKWDGGDQSEDISLELEDSGGWPAAEMFSKNQDAFRINSDYTPSLLNTVYDNVPVPSVISDEVEKKAQEIESDVNHIKNRELENEDFAGVKRPEDKTANDDERNKQRSGTPKYGGGVTGTNNNNRNPYNNSNNSRQDQNDMSATLRGGGGNNRGGRDGMNNPSRQDARVAPGDQRGFGRNPRGGNSYFSKDSQSNQVRNNRPNQRGGGGNIPSQVFISKNPQHQGGQEGRGKFGSRRHNQPRSFNNLSDSSSPMGRMSPSHSYHEGDHPRTQRAGSFNQQRQPSGPPSPSTSTSRSISGAQGRNSPAPMATAAQNSNRNSISSSPPTQNQPQHPSSYSSVTSQQYGQQQQQQQSSNTGSSAFSHVAGSSSTNYPQQQQQQTSFSKTQKKPQRDPVQQQTTSHHSSSEETEPTIPTTIITHTTPSANRQQHQQIPPSQSSTNVGSPSTPRTSIVQQHHVQPPEYAPPISVHSSHSPPIPVPLPSHDPQDMIENIHHNDSSSIVRSLSDSSGNILQITPGAAYNVQQLSNIQQNSGQSTPGNKNSALNPLASEFVPFTVNRSMNDNSRPESRGSSAPPPIAPQSIQIISQPPILPQSQQIYPTQYFVQPYQIPPQQQQQQQQTPQTIQMVNTTGNGGNGMTTPNSASYKTNHHPGANSVPPKKAIVSVQNGPEQNTANNVGAATGPAMMMPHIYWKSADIVQAQQQPQQMIPQQIYYQPLPNQGNLVSTGVPPSQISQTVQMQQAQHSNTSSGTATPAPPINYGNGQAPFYFPYVLTPQVPNNLSSQSPQQAQQYVFYKNPQVQVQSTNTNQQLQAATLVYPTQSTLAYPQYLPQQAHQAIPQTSNQWQTQPQISSQQQQIQHPAPQITQQQWGQMGTAIDLQLYQQYYQQQHQPHHQYQQQQPQQQPTLTPQQAAFNASISATYAQQQCRPATS
ncbi:unnamed protein product [Didymodactylos carnosus]|uniref:LsmAD domain-containing protein n=1 Tax=Didymodactylos carnosus TaxID=1234261 RepID=A0A813V1K5_9BILA|nr:unnamed protein product [Didymodactylos carnosus]CAF0838415.1 unnamed protein product [Didymodactylos carnosus]CAF3575637.1 unnamed protein product [Didymodactylos carnosus]CAF3625693.1 unnamed protein product [Didymodactylos carnosus]